MKTTRGTIWYRSIEGFLGTLFVISAQYGALLWLYKHMILLQNLDLIQLQVSLKPKYLIIPKP